MKALLAITIAGITTISNAETLSFPSFQIEIGNEWLHELERETHAQSDLGELVIIFRPNRNGILKIQPFSAPDIVSRAVLRNMTNVESSTALNWQDWGEYSGYQYDYAEGDSFYRQWWLTNERTILFIVYESNVESIDIEYDEINRIINSMTVNTL